MKYIGIDLGTTNSAICSYDGVSVTLYKSPEQNDVTPSAIFVDRRGNKYLGQRAYDNAAKNPDNAATKFKRMMGTSTPIKLSAVDLIFTPEDCSAEIIKLCFGYLPEEIRNSDDTGTVITVPASFNQMQKDATLAAAEMAGLGKIALMQEPVAAVMSVMKQRTGDGIFLVFDLGGGTLDIAIAESISSRVSLLAHGGVAMCGGTDFDRAILDNIVKPWLFTNFDLPEDLGGNQKYKTLLRMCLWASEKAKIDLSAKDETVISLTETDIGIVDESGAEIYVDIPFTRNLLDELIQEKINESIHAARDTLDKAGLSPNDIERIVFVGGPTQYKPLRDRVSFELGIAASTDVNPMTAVAKGAAVFAESIDWASESRGRKNARGTITTGGKLNLSFNYIARTPDYKATVIAKLDGHVVSGSEFQIDSLDTGWSSGRMRLEDGAKLELNLAKPGENTFKIFVFDGSGGSISLVQNKIIISRTAASIDAIPASHSIGVEAQEKIGGRLILEYLVLEGDHLPKKGKKFFKASESLTAGSTDSIKFKIWEGGISDPVSDNRFIGMFEIKGSDFEEGMIAAGADLVCEYEVLDSGNIVIEVTVPSIGGLFHSGRNFYSRQDGQIDYTKALKLVKSQSSHVMQRIEEMSSKINEPRLEQAREKLNRNEALKSNESDPETIKQAMDNVQEVKWLLAIIRKEHLKDIRRLELDNVLKLFDDLVREHARPSEESSYDNLVRTTLRVIENNGGDFEAHISELRHRNFVILWRQDWFIINRFKWLSEDTHLFADAGEHNQLVIMGTEALKANDIEKLRKVVNKLDSIRIDSDDESEMIAGANIVRV